MSRPAPTLNDPETVARLCAEYLGLARRMARSFRRACWDFQRDDFESAAMYALFRAAETWDRERSTFAIHASNRIWYALSYAWRLMKRRGRREFPLDEGSDHPYEPACEADSEDAFEALIRSLGAFPRQIMRRFYLDNDSLADMGREFGMTRANVSVYHRQALDQLREHLRPQS